MSETDWDICTKSGRDICKTSFRTELYAKQLHVGTCDKNSTWRMATMHFEFNKPLYLRNKKRWLNFAKWGSRPSKRTVAYAEFHRGGAVAYRHSPEYASANGNSVRTELGLLYVTAVRHFRVSMHPSLMVLERGRSAAEWFLFRVRRQSVTCDSPRRHQMQRGLESHSHTSSILRYSTPNSKRNCSIYHWNDRDVS